MLCYSSLLFLVNTGKQMIHTRSTLSNCALLHVFVFIPYAVVQLIYFISVEATQAQEFTSSPSE